MCDPIVRIAGVFDGLVISFEWKGDMPSPPLSIVRGARAGAKFLLSPRLLRPSGGYCYPTREHSSSSELISSKKGWLGLSPFTGGRGASHRYPRLRVADGRRAWFRPPATCDNRHRHRSYNDAAGWMLVGAQEDPQQTQDPVATGFFHAGILSSYSVRAFRPCSSPFSPLLSEALRSHRRTHPFTTFHCLEWYIPTARSRLPSSRPEHRASHSMRGTPLLIILLVGFPTQLWHSFKVCCALLPSPSALRFGKRRRAAALKYGNRCRCRGTTHCAADPRISQRSAAASSSVLRPRLARENVSPAYLGAAACLLFPNRGFIQEPREDDMHKSILYCDARTVKVWTAGQRERWSACSPSGLESRNVLNFHRPSRVRLRYFIMSPTFMEIVLTLICSGGSRSRDLS